MLALEVLYDAVVARFALEGPAGVAQPFGWRYPAQQHVGSRIIWIPGDPDGAVGRSQPARNPGGEPRSLATLEERFHVIISSFDPTAPEDERLQYRATRLLRDYWFRALYLAARGTFAIDSEEWLTEKKERRFGTAIRIVATVQSMVPDLPPTGEATEAAPADAEAQIDVEELDNTETLTVAP